MKVLSQYRGLRKELYILFWGRVVTNMGALIWPMLTLILKTKLGYTPGQASNLLIIVGIFMLPSTLIGGKLADRFSKKHIIVICDLITVAGYILCAFLPMSTLLVIVYCAAAIFAQMEWPSYDALVADFSSPEERERAYSLNYLGGNLGLVLAPTLGGLLFESHLPLAFFISGVATFSSTVLIFFFIKDSSLSKSSGDSGHYEEIQRVSTKEVFSRTPVLRLFVFCIGLASGIYSLCFGFLMPLNTEQVFGSRGALLFGTMTSTNALTVLLGTPLCTSLLGRLRDASKLQLGAALQVLGFLCFALAGKYTWLYYLSVMIFTLGEILLSLGKQPYITRRVPANHRGRMSAAYTVFGMFIQGILLLAAGHAADHIGLGTIWAALIGLAVLNLLLMFRMRSEDRRQFSLFYKN